MSKNKKEIAPNLRLNTLRVISEVSNKVQVSLDENKTMTATGNSTTDILYIAEAEFTTLQGGKKLRIELNTSEIEAIQEITKEAVKRAYNEIGVL